MNKENIPQQLYNLLEDAYRTFYHIAFVSKSSYGIIPNGLKIKKAWCNILRLFDVLPIFLFIISETMRDYYL